MALGNTNLKLSEIQTEFGGSNPISMSEYYKGGANVPNGATAPNGPIPTSGALAMGVFRGSANVTFTNATGGSITTSGNYKIHTFNNSGQFGVQALGTNSTFEYVLVAGGGGGGDAGPEGGAGGAAGVIDGSQTLNSATNYSVNIGSGGNGNGSDGAGSDGNNSVFSGNTTVTASGGGGARSGARCRPSARRRAPPRR